MNLSKGGRLNKKIAKNIKSLVIAAILKYVLNNVKTNLKGFHFEQFNSID